jgi:predicted aspartyl protease
MFVDTGATYSALPEELADEMQIHRIGPKYRISLADGTTRDMDVGSVIFRVLDREAPATVLIGPVEEPILGVETLEVLGLMVDPSSGRLRETRAWTVRLGGIR